MDYFVFNIEWPEDELNAPRITEWTLYNVLDVNDLDSALFSEFGCAPITYEFVTL
jgi:3'-phosphoadenosine 5'-phosphosulfate sulfotransferase (PAPS reductase)/FAD synthetase